MKSVSLISYFVLGILLIIIISGCDIENNNDSFRKGNLGLAINPLGGWQNSEVYEDNSFQIAFKIKNEGVFNISKGIFVVSADRDLIDYSNNKQIFDLRGRTKFFNEGEDTIITYDLKTKPLPLHTQMVSDIRSDICYPYNTIFSKDVCINSDIYNTYKDKPSLCNKDEMSISGGQGAPVAVTHVKLKMIPSEGGVIPLVEFEVRNLGRGLILNYNTYEDACSLRDYGFKNYGMINVDKAYLGSDVLECNNAIITINKEMKKNEYSDSRKAVIKCKGPLMDPSEPYVSNVRLYLKYGYKEHLKSKIIVVPK